MNPILQSLDDGYSAEEVFGFIQKAFPKLVSPLKKAQSAGYTIQQILGFLSKTSGTNEDRRGMSQSARYAANQRQDAANLKHGLGIAAGALATPMLANAARGALSRAVPGGIQGLIGSAGNALPSPGNLQNQTSPIPQQMSQQTPVSNNQIASQQPPVNQVVPNIPQNPPQVQPEGIPLPEEIGQGGWGKKIKELAQAGNGPEEIAGYLHKFHGKETKDLEKRANKPMQEIVSQFLSQHTKPEEQKSLESKVSTTVPTEEMSNVPTESEKVPNLGKMAEGITDNFYEGIFKSLQEEKDTFSGVKDPLITKAKPLFDEGKIKSVQDLKDFANGKLHEPPKLEKGSIAASPQGVGEVEAIRNGKAIINIDGKRHKVDEDELESESPDIVELYDTLFEALPPEHKSRMMNFAGYDEANNELLFRPHGGGAYVYKDIPKEFADMLKSQLHLAKTTGKNMYGMWHEGDPSYGAGISKLIKELQASYGGKGKEYIRKYDTLFDILGLPHELKKRKEKEERERKKQKP